MSMRYKGGVISATPPTTSISAATGMWTLVQQMQAQGAGNWPVVIGGPYWIGTLSSAGNDAGWAVSVDPFGNSYICGYSNSTGTTSFQIEKYNSSGTIQWQKSLGSSGISSFATAIVVDSSGNAYICGYAIGTYFVTTKYDTSGAIQWQKRLGTGTAPTSTGLSIALDSTGNIYASGFFGAFAGFQIVKYNNAGTLQWQRKFTLSNTYNTVVAVDASGNAHICGDFGDGSTYSGIQLFKYNTSGVIQWQKQINDSGSPFMAVYGVTVDLSNNVYVVGHAMLNGSDTHLVLFKYDSSGSLQWQRTLGASGVTTDGAAVAVDIAGNVYVCGRSYSGANKLLIAKYNTSGTIQWQRTLSSSNTETGLGIAVDSSANIYVTGQSGVGNINVLVAKLPSDGSLVGTYTVGGTVFTYAVSTLTASSTSYTSTTTAYSDAASTLADAASTLTDAATSLTSTVTTL